MNISETFLCFPWPVMNRSIAWSCLQRSACRGAHAFNGKKARMGHVILFIGFLSLAVSALRNVVLFVIIIMSLIGIMQPSGKIRRACRYLGKKKQTLGVHGVGHCHWSVLVDEVFSQARMLSIFPLHRSISPFVSRKDRRET